MKLIGKILFEYNSCKRFLLIVVAMFSFSCNNSESYSIEQIEDEFSSLPQLNTAKNNAIEVKISKCSFEDNLPKGNTLYKTSITKEGIKLLLGSELTCDFKNGAFIKEIENTSEMLSFDIFQKGTRLSNECECYFYYEITLKNATVIPKQLARGNTIFVESNINRFTESDLQVIENKLNN